MASFTESVFEAEALQPCECERGIYTVKHGPEKGRNVQTMHIALKRQDWGQECWPDRGRQLVQKMQQFS